MELTEGVGESSSPPRTFGGFSYYEMKSDIYNRLVENGNEEAVCNPGFRELLDAHFNRLPHRYDCFFIDLCWVSFCVFGFLWVPNQGTALNLFLLHSWIKFMGQGNCQSLTF